MFFLDVFSSTNFSGYALIQDPRARRRGGVDIFGDSFFSSSFGKRKKISTSSKEVIVNVKPLPEYRGEGQFSGLVGDFSLSSSVDRRSLKVGESLTLKVNLKGKGNIFDGNIRLPDSSNFKSYDDEPVFTKDENPNYFSGLKTFKNCLLYTSPSPRDQRGSRMPSSA